MKKSQNEAIREYLEAGHSITPLEALNKFGCFRLGARIADLKKTRAPNQEQAHQRPEHRQAIRELPARHRGPG